MFYLLLFSIPAIYGLGVFTRRLLGGNNFTSGTQRYPVGTHVIISGGSKGIGKALAIRFAELGTHVTIIARDQESLNVAKSEIEEHRRNSNVQQVRAVSLDLTQLAFPDNSQSDNTGPHLAILDTILGEHERCDILINCCGSAIAARFEDISQKQFQYMMGVNYFSAVNLTRILLPVMKARSLACQNGSRATNCSRIVFVSSISGLVSFYGYSAYSASKFALVGLAEALHMELKPFDIGVTISFPPDTDTPGFAKENETKPSLTAKISETGSVYNPDDVAKSIIDDTRAKKFCSTIGLENHLVLTAVNTFMPSQSILKVVLESLIVGPIRLAGYYILRSWHKLVDEAAPNEIIKAELAIKSSKTVKFSDKNQRN